MGSSSVQSILIGVAGLMVLLHGASPACAQARTRPALPHPDAVDWASNDRPGYRYRGMLPAQQRFYEYVQGKRLRGEPCTGIEVLMIRSLQAARRWPEAPRPNATARAYLQSVRKLQPEDMSFAQRLMLAQMRAQGLLPQDADPGPEISRLTEYLNSDAFRARNWFERWFGRVETWMQFVAASQGLDQRGPITPGIHQSPRAPGVTIHYAIAGAQLTRKPTEAWLAQYAGTTVFDMSEGVPLPGQVTVAGTVTSSERHRVRFRAHYNNPAGLLEEWDEGRFRTKAVWDEWEFVLEPGQSRDFTLTVPTLPQCQPGNPNRYGYVDVTLRANATDLAGGRALSVDGSPVVAINLTPCPAAWAASSDENVRRRADAAWQAEVEKTLQELGATQTAAGRELARTRAAVARGDAAWQEHVKQIQQQLAQSEESEEKQFDLLAKAMNAGGPAWEGYLAARESTTTVAPSAPPPAAPAPAAPAPPQATSAVATAQGKLPDVGGLVIGTSHEQGRVAGAAERFPQASQISGVLNFTGLPQGATAVGVWTRDGAEITRSERTVGGTGWVSFTLKTGSDAGLRPGAYTLTVLVGNAVLGRRTVAIGSLN
jgi:hypothetical protein